jgi:hypothetical protein
LSFEISFEALQNDYVCPVGGLRVGGSTHRVPPQPASAAYGSVDVNIRSETQKSV